MSNDLKPCPFCGGEAEIIHKHDILNDDYEVYIKCTECNSQTQTCNTTAISGEPLPPNPLPYLVEIWNKRKPIDDIVEKLEERAETHEKIMLGCANVQERHAHLKTEEAFRQAIEIVKEEQK